MAKFIVCVQRMIEETSGVEIEAESEEAARAKVQAALAEDVNLSQIGATWDPGDLMDTPAIYAVMEDGEVVWER